ncbi:MAG: hypothetical protein J6D37_02895 [Clostridia bacterium]|nr:hypothetical protein [Clostridia bacterium]
MNLFTATNVYIAIFIAWMIFLTSLILGRKRKAFFYAIIPSIAVFFLCLGGLLVLGGSYQDCALVSIFFFIPLLFHKIGGKKQ